MEKFAKSFRDEIITTGLVMIVVVVGSFYILDKFAFNESDVDGVLVDEEILGVIDERIAKKRSASVLESNGTRDGNGLGAVSNISPTPSPTTVGTPTPTPKLTEIPYRPSKEFENDDYLISFSRPRVMVGESRTFMVEVLLVNKAVKKKGFTNRLFATVVKNGEIIVQEAVMSNSENETLDVSENVTFTASLALIESTDVSQLIFVPGDSLPQVTYQISPL